VYRSVAQDFASAGGGIIRTYESIDPEIRSQLNILWKSKGYTPHAIAAHPRVSSAEVARLQAALQNLSLSEQGRAALGRINFTAVIAAQDSDWDDVRDLQIDILTPQE
jgi:phosphonate transport system substrate-binding protein